MENHPLRTRRVISQRLWLDRFHRSLLASGALQRFNLLGYLVLEAYYAYPFQRPAKGAHFGVQLLPGW